MANVLADQAEGARSTARAQRGALGSRNHCARNGPHTIARETRPAPPYSICTHSFLAIAEVPRREAAIHAAKRHRVDARDTGCQRGCNPMGRHASPVHHQKRNHSVVPPHNRPITQLRQHSTALLASRSKRTEFGRLVPVKHGNMKCTRSVHNYYSCVPINIGTPIIESPH